MTPTPSDVEVLPQLTRAPRSAWVLVAVLVLALVAVGLHDRRAHAAGSARVEACATAAVAAQALADRRVSAMASYVRPALSGADVRSVRTSLSRLVAGAARESTPALDAARTGCARVEVRPWHGDLSDRVDACLAKIDARLDWLHDVADDGGRAFTSVPDRTPPGCAA